MPILSKKKSKYMLITKILFVCLTFFLTEKPYKMSFIESGIHNPQYLIKIDLPQVFYISHHVFKYHTKKIDVYI